ncbi:hypothetical protein PTSG_02064 [Salpingoeca rosetta]|uniref:Integrator complex subunit 1 R3 domain-containing protein n=1 Tax=Salpingoeca rosetta (strain ATCC 50818 / BSB-021) TaxID=946362 RepID=F2TZS4_SALR5|nr:uncharacterized protein PTSG_02064 [Salpingoeca rosetta]EGD79098.1 hypothetical protein PTSG_02064 [Salpingoeca rosetta]|eukprot:XP_004998054.1 hypothetical protein PTSG_02064 [Salpingoeca rosetta]
MSAGGGVVTLGAVRDRLAKAYQRCLMVRATDASLVTNEREFKRQIQDHEAAHAQDRVSELIHAALAHAIKAQNDPTTVCVTLLLLAKQSPTIFSNTKVLSVLMAMFRAHMQWPSADRATMVRAVAGRLLLVGLSGAKTWPLDLVALYVEDALSRREWIENPLITAFIRQIETAFKVSPLPETPLQQPRFVGLEKQVSQLCVEAVNHLKPAAVKPSSLAAAMKVLANVPGVAAAAAKQFQAWLGSNAGTSNQLRDLISVMKTIVSSNDKSVLRPILMLKLPNTPVVSAATHNLVDVFVSALLAETNRNVAKLTQRAQTALAREFDGKGTLQDNAAIKIGFEKANASLMQQAADMMHKTLISAPDPRNKLRAFVRRLSLIEGFSAPALCEHLLKASRACNLGSMPHKQLVSYVTHVLEVYAQVLACAVPTHAMATAVLAFSRACDQPFMATAPDDNDDDHDHNHNARQASSDRMITDEDSSSAPAPSARASATLDGAARAVKRRVAAAQEAGLLWLVHMLDTHLRETPTGYIAYQLRRLFFLTDAKSFLGRNVADASPQEFAGYELAARHHPLPAHVVPTIVALATKRPDLPGSDALDILYRIVGSTTTFHVHFGLPVDVPDAESLIHAILRLSVYTLRFNVSLPPNFAPPPLVVATAYQQALVVILCLCALNAKVLDAAWSTVPALRTIISTTITRNFKHLQPSQLSDSETDWILAYEQFLAMTFKEATPTRASSKLLGKVDLVEPDVIGNKRLPSAITLQAVRELDHHVNMQAVLLDCREPDMLQRVLARTATSSVPSAPGGAQAAGSLQGEGTTQEHDLGWLSAMLATRRDLIERIPGNILGKLLLSSSSSVHATAVMSKFTQSLATTPEHDLHRLTLDLVPRLHSRSPQARAATRFVLASIAVRVSDRLRGVEADAAATPAKVADVVLAIMQWCRRHDGGNETPQEAATAAAETAVGEATKNTSEAVLWQSFVTAALHEEEPDLAAAYLVGLLLYGCDTDCGAEDNEDVHAIKDQTGSEHNVNALLLQLSLIAHARPRVLECVLLHTRGATALSSSVVMPALERCLAAAGSGNGGDNHGGGGGGGGGDDDDDDGLAPDAKRGKGTDAAKAAATQGCVPDERMVASMCIAITAAAAGGAGAAWYEGARSFVDNLCSLVLEHMGGSVLAAVQRVRPCEVHAAALIRLRILPAVVSTTHLHLWLQSPDTEVVTAVLADTPSRVLLRVLTSALTVSEAAIIAAATLTFPHTQPAKSHRSGDAGDNDGDGGGDTENDGGGGGDANRAEVLQQWLRERLPLARAQSIRHNLQRAVDVLSSEQNSQACTLMRAALAACLRTEQMQPGTAASTAPTTTLTAASMSMTPSSAEGTLLGHGRKHGARVADEFTQLLSGSLSTKATLTVVTRVLRCINRATAATITDIAEAFASSWQQQQQQRKQERNPLGPRTLAHVRGLVGRITAKAKQLEMPQEQETAIPLLPASFHTAYRQVLGRDRTTTPPTTATAVATAATAASLQQAALHRAPVELEPLHTSEDAGDAAEGNAHHVLTRLTTQDATMSQLRRGCTRGFDATPLLLHAFPPAPSQDAAQEHQPLTAAQQAVVSAVGDAIAACLVAHTHVRMYARVASQLRAAIMAVVTRHRAHLHAAVCAIITRVFVSSAKGRVFGMEWCADWPTTAIDDVFLATAADLLLRRDARGRLMLSRLLHVCSAEDQRALLRHVAYRVHLHVNGVDSDSTRVVETWDPALTHDALAHLTRAEANRSCLPHNKDALVLDMCAVARVWAWIWAVSTAGDKNSSGDADGIGLSTTPAPATAIITSSNVGIAVDRGQEQRLLAVLRTQHALMHQERGGSGTAAWVNGGARPRNALEWLLLDAESCVQFVLFSLGLAPSISQHKSPAMVSGGVVEPTQHAADAVMALVRQITRWRPALFPATAQGTRASAGTDSSSSSASSASNASNASCKRAALLEAASVHVCTALLGACRLPVLSTMVVAGGDSAARSTNARNSHSSSSNGNGNSSNTGTNGSLAMAYAHMHVDGAVHRLVSRLLAPPKRRKPKAGTIIGGGAAARSHTSSDHGAKDGHDGGNDQEAREQQQQQQQGQGEVWWRSYAVECAVHSGDGDDDHGVAADGSSGRRPAPMLQTPSQLARPRPAMQGHALLATPTGGGGDTASAVPAVPVQFEDDLVLALDDLSVSHRPRALAAYGSGEVPTGCSGDAVVSAVLAAQRRYHAAVAGGGHGDACLAVPDLVEDDLDSGAWLLLLNPDASQLASLSLLAMAHRVPLAVCRSLPQVAGMLQGLLHFTGSEMVRRRYHSLFVHAAAVVAAVARNTSEADWLLAGACLSTVIDPFVDIVIHHAESDVEQMTKCVLQLVQFLLEIACCLPSCTSTLANFLPSLEQAARVLRDPVVHHLVLQLTTAAPETKLKRYVPRVGRMWELMLYEARSVLQPASPGTWPQPLTADDEEKATTALRSLITLSSRFPSMLRGLHDVVCASIGREEVHISRAGYVLATLCATDHPNHCEDIVRAHCRVLSSSPWLPAVRAALRASHVLYACECASKRSSEAMATQSVLHAALTRCNKEATLDIVVDAPHLWHMIV